MGRLDSELGEFYELVPRDLAGNINFREELRTAAAKDAGLQREIKQACEQDILYFFSAWLWVKEPRKSSASRIIPFVPWPHQEKAIQRIDDTIAQVLLTGVPTDIRCQKSRGEGWSWLGMAIALRDWLFRPQTMIGVVSRNEEMADSSDPDSLMAKLDFMIELLPPWMLPEGFNPKVHRNRTDHTLRNPELFSNIKGYAATQDVASGGRLAWLFFDELAKWLHGSDQHALNSTEPVTDCRLIGSSPKGDSGAFYKLITETEDCPSA